MNPAELRAALDACDQHRAGAYYAQLAASLPGLLQHACPLVAGAAAGSALFAETERRDAGSLARFARWLHFC